MKHLGTMLAAASLIAAPLAAASPAAADTEGCVTKAEFASVRKGWSLTRVKNRFDTAGRQTWFMSATKDSNATQGREYRPCHKPAYSLVSVDYVRKKGVWRVTGKFAYWG